jgi:glycosyltransferase involved in cell wall biosynthesis
VRILVVGQTMPWPANDGARQRLANVVTALTSLGDVDLFALVNARSGVELPPDAPVDRLRASVRAPSEFRGLRRLSWLLSGSLPTAFLRPYEGIRREFRDWARTDYDLVWLSRLESYVAVGSGLPGPQIVDIDDLEDQSILARLAALRDRGSWNGRSRLGQPAMNVYAKRNARLWRHLQRSVAERADAVVVTNEQDRTRLDVPNAVIVPNGYERPTTPLGRVTVHQPPTILFVGFHRHPPNADGCRYLVEQVGPLLWDRLPDARIRIVGEAGEVVRRLHEPPRVTVTGAVANLAAELERADVAAVPIPYGSGTRIKILEAFAHRIPVVATRIGAEGIDAADGRHLLIGDRVDAFARACVDLLTDRDLRGRMTEAAHQLFLRHYQWSTIRERITGLAGALAGSPGVPVRFR